MDDARLRELQKRQVELSDLRKRISVLRQELSDRSLSPEAQKQRRSALDAAQSAIRAREKSLAEAASLKDVLLKRIDQRVTSQFIPAARLALPDTRLSLDLNNVTINEALDKIKELAQSDTQSFHLDAPASDVRISLRAEKIRLTTALDVICQAAGLDWQAAREGDKLRYHVGPQRAGATVRRSVNPLATVLDFGRALDPAQVEIRSLLREQRHTFTCPHCKGQATVLRQNQSPKCAKCDRLFASDWQFCPADGSKRPPAPGQWQFCPQCGKRVEKAEALLEVPALSKIRVAGNPFRSRPAPADPAAPAKVLRPAPTREKPVDPASPRDSR